MGIWDRVGSGALRVGRSVAKAARAEPPPPKVGGLTELLNFKHPLVPPELPIEAPAVITKQSPRPFSDAQRQIAEKYNNIIEAGNKDPELRKKLLAGIPERSTLNYKDASDGIDDAIKRAGFRVDSSSPYSGAGSSGDNSFYYELADLNRNKSIDSAVDRTGRLPSNFTPEQRARMARMLNANPGLNLAGFETMGLNAGTGGGRLYDELGGLASSRPDSIMILQGALTDANKRSTLGRNAWMREVLEGGTPHNFVQPLNLPKHSSEVIQSILDPVYSANRSYTSKDAFADLAESKFDTGQYADLLARRDIRAAMNIPSEMHNTMGNNVVDMIRGGGYDPDLVAKLIRTNLGTTPGIATKTIKRSIPMLDEIMNENSDAMMRAAMEGRMQFKRGGLAQVGR